MELDGITVVYNAPKSRFRKQEVIRGIEMACQWSSDYSLFVLELQQAEDGNKGRASKEIIISKDAEMAKKIFIKAKILAEAGLNIYQIYVAVCKEIERLEQN